MGAAVLHNAHPSGATALYHTPHLSGTKARHGLTLNCISWVIMVHVAC